MVWSGGWTIVVFVCGSQQIAKKNNNNVPVDLKRLQATSIWGQFGHPLQSIPSDKVFFWPNTNQLSEGGFRAGSGGGSQSPGGISQCLLYYSVYYSYINLVVVLFTFVIPPRKRGSKGRKLSKGNECCTSTKYMQNNVFFAIPNSFFTHIMGTHFWQVNRNGGDLDCALPHSCIGTLGSSVVENVPKVIGWRDRDADVSRLVSYMSSGPALAFISFSCECQWGGL